MKIRKHKRHIIFLLVLITFAFLTLFCIKGLPDMTQALINRLVSDMEKTNVGKIVMPKDYAVLKISAGQRVIVHETGKHVHVGADIREAGWNSRYIIYRRVTGDGHRQTGLIDTEEDRVYELSPNEIEDKMLELQLYGDIQLKKVEALFPETK